MKKLLALCFALLLLFPAAQAETPDEIDRSLVEAYCARLQPLNEMYVAYEAAVDRMEEYLAAPGDDTALALQQAAAQALQTVENAAWNTQPLNEAQAARLIENGRNPIEYDVFFNVAESDRTRMINSLNGILTNLEYTQTIIALGESRYADEQIADLVAFLSHERIYQANTRRFHALCANDMFCYLGEGAMEYLSGALLDLWPGPPDPEVCAD